MKISTLIDTNILIDVWGPRVETTDWSLEALTSCRDAGELVVNSIVWSELAPAMSEAMLNAYVVELGIEREHLPWQAAYAAGVSHSRYRRAGGMRDRTLPDFLIGAHARHSGHRLLTRDPARYRSYFPQLEIVAPDARQ